MSFYQSVFIFHDCQLSKFAIYLKHTFQKSCHFSLLTTNSLHISSSSGLARFIMPHPGIAIRSLQLCWWKLEKTMHLFKCNVWGWQHTVTYSQHYFNETTRIHTLKHSLHLIQCIGSQFTWFNLLHWECCELHLFRIHFCSTTSEWCLYDDMIAIGASWYHHTPDSFFFLSNLCIAEVKYILKKMYKMESVDQETNQPDCSRWRKSDLVAVQVQNQTGRMSVVITGKQSETRSEQIKGQDEKKDAICLFSMCG